MFLKEPLGLEPVTALFAFWCPWDEHLPPAHSPPERLTLTWAQSDLDRPKPLKPSAGSRPSSFLGCVSPTAEADWDSLNVFWEVIPSAIIANCCFGGGGGGRFDLLVFRLHMECSLNSNMKFKDLVSPLVFCTLVYYVATFFRASIPAYEDWARALQLTLGMCLRLLSGIKMPLWCFCCPLAKGHVQEGNLLRISSLQIEMPELPYAVKWLLYKYIKKDLEERGLQVLI